MQNIMLQEVSSTEMCSRIARTFYIVIHRRLNDRPGMMLFVKLYKFITLPPLYMEDGHNGHVSYNVTICFSFQTRLFFFSSNNDKIKYFYLIFLWH